MPFDLDSTLIRRGRSSVTLSEIATFVRTLEERPVATLLGETPGDQLQLCEIAHEIAGDVDDRYVADRIREIFASERA